MAADLISQIIGKGFILVHLELSSSLSTTIKEKEMKLLGTENC